MKSSAAFLLCAITLCSADGLFAGELRYPVQGIPAGLRKDTDAIIREDRETLTVRGPGEARFQVHRALTIFSKSARDLGSLSLSYDGRLTTIKDLEGWVYDAQGAEVRELEDRDVRDESDISGYSIYDESRERTAELYHDRYPYTVVYEYELAFQGVPGYLRWIAQGGREPIEHSSLEVLTEDTTLVSYYTNSSGAKPQVSRADGETRYFWEVRNLPELSVDVVEEDVDKRTTVVDVAPSRFQVEGHEGDLSSWKAFGVWFRSLYQGRNLLPESAKLDMKRLLRPEDSPRQKAAALYRYMQDRCRYVSIQLGVGGWQPFDAKYVHEHSYGDCKALSNYLVALLGEAGIPAYPALIYAGSRGHYFAPEFPSNQFNHVIVCAPMGTDSLWFECTSSTMPPGHLSDDTQNRYALLVAPEGGVLVRTPGSTAVRNRQHRVTHVRVAGGGMVEGTMVTRLTGCQVDDTRSRLSHMAPEERQRWLLEDLHISNARIGQIRIEGLAPQDSLLSVQLDLSAPTYASASGNRLFLVPNLAERRTYIPRDVKARRSPVRFPYPYTDEDSTWFHLPNGYAKESLPAEVALHSSFGDFHASTRALGDTAVVYTRALTVRQFDVPPERYPEYRQFFEGVVRADQAQAVFVRK